VVVVLARCDDSDRQERRNHVSNGDFPLPGEVGEQFLCLARYPKNIGWLDNPGGTGAAVGNCGDSIEVTLRIETGAIADITILPLGCIYTLVCSSAMSELAKERALEQALDLEPYDVVNALGGLPEDHLYCARLTINTLGEAIADYYRRASLSASGGSP
jgi:nitrogen fixation NifU-like protein